jgi:hypothetical protein
MPMYEFRKESGEVVEVFLSFEQFDKRVKNGQIVLDDGEKATYDWQQHSKMQSLPANYPMVCTAAGVHPGQIKEHMEHLRQQGCGQVNHTKDGDIIFESKGQRKKVCEALGLFDRQAGYSDPQPKYRTASCKRYNK